MINASSRTEASTTGSTIWRGTESTESGMQKLSMWCYGFALHVYVCTITLDNEEVMKTVHIYENSTCICTVFICIHLYFTCYMYMQLLTFTKIYSALSHTSLHVWAHWQKYKVVGVYTLQPCVVSEYNVMHVAFYHNISLFRLSRSTHEITPYLIYRTPHPVLQGALCLLGLQWKRQK